MMNILISMEYQGDNMKRICKPWTIEEKDFILKRVIHDEVHPHDVWEEYREHLDFTPRTYPAIKSLLKDNDISYAGLKRKNKLKYIKKPTSYNLDDMPKVPSYVKHRPDKLRKFTIPYDGFKVLVLPDPHLKTKPDGKTWMPDVSLALWAALNFGEDFKPDMVILLGDLMELEMISHYAKNNLRLREQMRLEHDFEFTNQVLNRIDKISKGEKVYLFGNHETRIETYLNENPELEGMLSIEKKLHLEERGWKFFKEGKVIKVGHACFTHGWYYNIYHARKHVSEMGDNIFYGHVHDVQSFSKPNPAQMPIIGQSLGCLCDLNPAWKRNKPNRWVNAFGIFYFSKDGNFTYYTPIIVNGGFWWNGKYYTSEGVNND